MQSEEKVRLRETQWLAEQQALGSHADIPEETSQGQDSVSETV